MPSPMPRRPIPKVPTAIPSVLLPEPKGGTLQTIVRDSYIVGGVTHGADGVTHSFSVSGDAPNQTLTFSDSDVPYLTIVSRLATAPGKHPVVVQTSIHNSSTMLVFEMNQETIGPNHLQPFAVGHYQAQEESFDGASVVTWVPVAAARTTLNPQSGQFGPWQAIASKTVSAAAVSGKSLPVAGPSQPPFDIRLETYFAGEFLRTSVFGTLCTAPPSVYYNNKNISLTPLLSALGACLGQGLVRTGAIGVGAKAAAAAAEVEAAPVFIYGCVTGLYLYMAGTLFLSTGAAWYSAESGAAAGSGGGGSAGGGSNPPPTKDDDSDQTPKKEKKEVK